MKFDSSNGTITESNAEDVEVIDMGFSMDAIPHLTRMFTSLYNNPEEAVYREVLFNAIDATNKIGSEEKIVVYLPSYDTPILTITDKGVGMTKEKLSESVQFGGTDKSEDNDLVGGFGLGFKSPLAITPQFTVETIKDGIRTVGTVSNSEDGICRLTILVSEPTAKSSGTSVSIPVKSYDTFIEVIRRYTRYVPENMIEYRNKFYPFREENHYTSYEKILPNLYFERGNSITVVMGGVPYIISQEEIKNHLPELRGVLIRGTTVEVPIGSIVLSPSREGVQFTNKTKQSMLKMIKEVYDEAEEELYKSIEESDTLFEARNVYRSHGLARLIEIRDLDWHGIPLDKDVIDFGYKPSQEYGRDKPYQVQRILNERSSASRVDFIPITRNNDTKMYFISNDEEVSPSRVTYITRRYFQKNEIPWDASLVYKLFSPFEEYVAIDDISIHMSDGREFTTLKGQLDLFKENYEVIDASTMKADITGWKPVSEAKEQAEKVKYLERETKLLDLSGDVTKYVYKSLGEILKDNGTFVVHEYRTPKRNAVHVQTVGLSTSLVKRYFKEVHGKDVDGIIILQNNAKFSTLEKNTKKLGCDYFYQADLGSINEYAKINQLIEALKKDIPTRELLSFSGYHEWLEKNRGSFDDPEVSGLFITGTETFSTEDTGVLRSTVMTDDNHKYFVEFLKKYCPGLPDDYAVEYYGYSSGYSIVQGLVRDHIKEIVSTKYPLINLNKTEDSIEYMNLLFDKKYKK